MLCFLNSTGHTCMSGSKLDLPAHGELRNRFRLLFYYIIIIIYNICKAHYSQTNVL